MLIGLAACASFSDVPAGDADAIDAPVADIDGWVFIFSCVVEPPDAAGYV